MPNKEGSNTLADRELIQGLEHLERNGAEIDSLREDNKEVMATLKSAGHPPKIVKALLALRQMDEKKRAEARVERELLGDYIDAFNL